MKKLIKLISLALALLLVFAFAGCDIGGGLDNELTDYKAAKYFYYSLHYTRVIKLFDAKPLVPLKLTE